MRRGKLFTSRALTLPVLNSSHYLYVEGGSGQHRAILNPNAQTHNVHHYLSLGTWYTASRLTVHIRPCVSLDQSALDRISGLGTK